MEYKLTDLNESYTELETEDIDFKKKVIDTLSVFEEGYLFSPLFRSGIWDGKKAFYTIERNNNIRFPKGLVAYIIKDLQKNKLKYIYDTNTTVENITMEELQLHIKSLNLAFEPYDYQIESVFNMIKYKRGVQQAATGSGKSLMLYIFITWLNKNNKKTLLVVPSISLTLQMKGDFEDYGMKDIDDKITLIGGDNKVKDFSKNIIISTWQSLQNMKKETFEMFDAITVDEAHTVNGQALQNVINNAIKSSWKVGVTGTVPRNRVEKLQLLATLGRIYKVITPQGLIERGLATPVFINLLYLNYKDEDKRHVKSAKMKYPEEEKFINSHHERNMKVSKIMDKLTNKNNGENVLCLFTKVDHGLKLLTNAIINKTNSDNFELLDKFTPKHIKLAIEKWLEDEELVFYINKEITKEDIVKVMKTTSKHLNKEQEILFINSLISLIDIKIYFIYGGVDGESREDIRKALEEDTGIQIIASYGTTQAGVNYKNLHHIVLSSSTKSFVRLSQTIGRGMRKHESKTSMHIWDIIDDLTPSRKNSKENYMLKHSFERIEIYREQEYPITEKEIGIL